MHSQIKIKIFSLGVVAVVCAIFLFMGGTQNFLEGFQFESSKRAVLQDISDIPQPLRSNMSSGALRETYVRFTLQQRDYYYNKLRGAENTPNTPADKFLKKVFENYSDNIGELPREDFEILAQQAFDVVDFDRDGTISKKEHQVFQQTMFDLPQSCQLPSLSKEVNLVSIGIHEGLAISSATASGQDRATTAVTIRVEETGEPLSVVLLSRTPVIWQFLGNTSAVHQVILNGFNENGIYQSANGVSGISKDYVHFLDPKCITPYFQSVTREGFLAKSAMKQIFGRFPDNMIGEFEVNSVSISPKGPKISSDIKELFYPKMPTPPEFDLELFSVFLRYYPAGITEVDPNTVVSTGHVEKYTVLPKIAGLAQLVHQNKITPIPGAMKVVKDIPRYPSELGEINLILATGISIPGGQAGMACVWREDTWELLYNRGNGRCSVATDKKRLAY